MIKTGYPRPCPIPGHPQDADEPVLVTESAWARLRAWHLHAPAERLPLPVILLAWPSAWILHAAHVPGHVVTYAAVAAAVACWLTWHRHERDSWAPAAAPDRGRPGRRGPRRLDGRRGHVGAARLARAPADLDLPGRRRGRVLVAAPPRSRPGRPPAPRGRRRLGGEEGRMAPGRAPDRPGRLPPADGHPDAARRGAPAHQRAGQRPGVPGRPERRRDRREIRPPGRPALRPGGHQHHRLPRPAGHRHPPRGPVRQGHRVPPAHHPVAMPGAVPVRRLVPRRGHDPRPGPGRDHPRDRRADDPDPVRRDRRQGHRGARRHRQRQVHPAQRRPGTGHRDDRRRPGAAQRRAHGRRAHLGAAGRGHRLRPRGQRPGGPGQDPRRAGVGAAPGHRAVGHPRRRPGTACSSRPRTTRPTS